MSDPAAAILVYVALATGLFSFNDAGLLYVAMRVLRKDSQIAEVSDVKAQAVPDSKLPVISILLPLYREKKTLPFLIGSILGSKYPKEKLDVRFLVEHDDRETINVILDLPAARVGGIDYDKYGIPRRIKVQNGPTVEIDYVYRGVRTKPNALNMGLANAKGEIITIYDAEDRPDPNQLRKVAAYMIEHPDVACVQARLSYYNPDQSLLTKFFSVEYTQHFLAMLPEFKAMKVMIPLGGTSNFFRTEVLRELQGWDAYNVTEDADLGIRLAKKGYLTVPINTVTWEEAPPKLYYWIRQRVRWNKGFLYTLVKHFRHPVSLVRSVGLKSTFYGFLLLFYPVISAVSVVGWVFFVVYWANWFGLPLQPVAGWVQAAFEYNPYALYILTGGFIFGILYSSTISVEALFREGSENSLRKVKYAIFTPLYQMLHALASIIAIAELIVKPNVWHKTPHGFSVEEEEEGGAKSG
ncbi:MAG: glycosyltransferase [Nitrososphaerales archaeon]|nr:glycosyltransferase [Nitrososphaerales archaeon]